MFIIWYDKVVSRLPLFVEQNINAGAPLKFKRGLEIKISKEFKHYSYTTINRIPVQAYYTKNDSCAFKKVLKERMETQHKNKRIALRRGKQGFTMC